MLDTFVFLSALFLVFCILIFLSDLLFRKVPNNWLMIALAVQLGCFVMLGKGLNGVLWFGALSGFVIGMLVFLPLYALRAMGAGDVKFFAVLGFLLGLSALLPIFLIASLLAGLHASAIYMLRLGLAPGVQLMLMRMARWPLYQRVLAKRGSRDGIPYAAYLALAACYVAISSNGALM